MRQYSGIVSTIISSSSNSNSTTSCRKSRQKDCMNEVDWDIGSLHWSIPIISQKQAAGRDTQSQGTDGPPLDAAHLLRPSPEPSQSLHAPADMCDLPSPRNHFEPTTGITDFCWRLTWHCSSICRQPAQRRNVMDDSLIRCCKTTWKPYFYAAAQRSVVGGILFLSCSSVRPCVRPETLLTRHLAEYLNIFTIN